MTANQKTLYRLDQLEKNYEKIETRLDAILENHLPHLQMELEALKTRVNVLTAINIGAIILALLINKYL